MSFPRRVGRDRPHRLRHARQHLGLQPFRYDEPQDFYEIVRHRYERGAMVLTSHRATEEWYPLFDDPLLASAAMDRLLHHSHVIEMIGDSYRNPPASRRTA